MRAVIILGAVAALSACRDAASETPVDLQPGLYDLSSSGIILESGGERGSVCLSATDARDFSYAPLRNANGAWRDCTDTAEPRQGNAVIGKRFCKGARFRDDDESIYTYVAEISTDGFVIKGETKDKEDGSGPDTGPWRIVARRTGDC
jgi:hypothetical protein